MHLLIKLFLNQGLTDYLKVSYYFREQKIKETDLRIALKENKSHSINRKNKTLKKPKWLPSQTKHI